MSLTTTWHVNDECPRSILTTPFLPRHTRRASALQWLNRPSEASSEGGTWCTDCAGAWHGSATCLRLCIDEGETRVGSEVSFHLYHQERHTSDSIPAAYALELGDWRLMKTGWVDPRRRTDAAAARPRMLTISMMTLSQRVANAAAFSQTFTMLAIESMLSQRPAHLKMPSSDAHHKLNVPSPKTRLALELRSSR